jgi:2-methylisocitrate lyase-like PEP mutase family enzyme
LPTPALGRSSVGLSGASIEDATYRADHPLFERSLAVERIHAAVEAARALLHPFVLTARAESFIRGFPDLDDALWRLQAYEKAGADVLLAPGLPSEQALRLVCGSLHKPFNYVVGCGPTRFTLAELHDIGVRRVSIGSTFAPARLPPRSPPPARCWTTAPSPTWAACRRSPTSTNSSRRELEACHASARACI